MPADRYGLATAASLTVGFLATDARAFVQPGHDAIEVAAYQRLFDEPSTDAGPSPGRRVICDLMYGGFVRAPDGFSLQECLSHRASASADVLPVASSGDVDLDTTLQLGNGGQCYHFMAARIDEEYDRPDLFSAATEPFPFQLNYAALPRCLRLLASLTEQSTDAATSRARRFTVTRQLIHAVADSYSRAHVERDEQYRVRWLKVWDLVAPFDGRSQGQKTRHAASDERDKLFVRACDVGATACDPDKHPNHLIPPACFSSDGNEAVRAVADALRVVHALWAARVRPKVENFGPWISFVNQHFRSATEWSVASVSGKETLPNVGVAKPWDYGNCRPETASLVPDPVCPRLFETLHAAAFYLNLTPMMGHKLDASGWAGGVGASVEMLFPEVGYDVAAMLSGGVHSFVPAFDPSVSLGVGEFDRFFLLEGQVSWLAIPLHPAFDVALAPVYVRSYPAYHWAVSSGVRFVSLDLVRLDQLGYGWRSWPLRVDLTWGELNWVGATSRVPVVDLLSGGLSISFAPVSSTY